MTCPHCSAAIICHPRALSLPTACPACGRLLAEVVKRQKPKPTRKVRIPKLTDQGVRMKPSQDSTPAIHPCAY